MSCAKKLRAIHRWLGNVRLFVLLSAMSLDVRGRTLNGSWYKWLMPKSSVNTANASAIMR